MDILEKIDLFVGENTGATDWNGPKVPMTRKEALAKLKAAKNDEERGFYVSVAHAGNASQKELSDALGGKKYKPFKGDINAKQGR